MDRAYEDTLKELREAFPGQRRISLSQAAKYLNTDPRTLAKSRIRRMKEGSRTYINIPVLADYMSN